MLPSRRLLFFSLIAGILIASAIFTPVMLYVTLLYMIAVIILVIIDYALTVQPTEIEIERINDSKLSIGAMNPITLLLTNRGKQIVRFRIRDEHPYQFVNNDSFIEGEVAPYSMYESCYYVLPLQRGLYYFGDINLRYTSKLKTFIRQARYNAQAEVKVYPNILEVRKYDIMARKGLLHELGLRQSRLLGIGNEFERLREYNADDEFRHINWKATARRGKPIAAEYETERSQYIINMIDTGRLMQPQIGALSKLDYVINTALLLSYVVTLKGDYVGLLTFADSIGTYVPPKRGKGQFYRLLESLYSIQFEQAESNFDRAMGYLSVKHKRRSLVAIFTDLTTLDAAKSLIANASRLSRQHLVLCITISDPNVTRFTEQRLMDSSATYRRAVAETLLDERQVILDSLNRNGVLTLDVPADKLTVSVINTYLMLKERGKL